MSYPSIDPIILLIRTPGHAQIYWYWFCVKFLDPQITWFLSVLEVPVARKSSSYVVRTFYILFNLHTYMAKYVYLQCAMMMSRKKKKPKFVYARSTLCAINTINAIVNVSFDVINTYDNCYDF